MKINIADIPVNILDGFAKYPDTSLFTAGLYLGFLSASVIASEWPLVFSALAAGVGILTVAWWAGKPK